MQRGEEGEGAGAEVVREWEVGGVGVRGEGEGEEKGLIEYA